MTALYIRLSKEDAAAGESGSVKNQRSILRSYAQSKGITDTFEYIDDGFSGTSTERPAFLRLKKDIESGVVDTVIVKDLSRLARNSNDANTLIDEYFPLHNVRFISVGESIDTENPASSVMLAPLANMMHEFYSRDISAKIRSALYSKMDNGQFVGARPPLGYTPVDGILTPDENANTVRWIFSLAARGEPPSQISEKTGITAPRIRRIIRNEVYVGTLRQGKTKKLSFKSKTTVRVRPDLCHTVIGAHAPLVSSRLFSAANRQLDRRTGEKRGFENVFSGIAYCADCGARMSTVGTRRADSPCALACGRYKQKGSTACTNHHIDYLTLYNTVLGELNGHLKQFSDIFPLEELTPRLLFSLVSKIEIFQGEATHEGREQKIKIVYRFAAC